MNFHERLREERERLDLSQEKFGSLGGVKKLAQINYEKGERHPDSQYLAAIAAAGVDVLYILTGQRTQEAHTTGAKLEPDEEILLDNYRNSPADAKAAIKAASDAFARPTSGAKRNKAA